MKQTAVAIIGAGPAGMAAASTLARHNVPCVVLDEQIGAGGQIYRGIEVSGLQRQQILGQEYSAGLKLADGLKHPAIETIQGAVVWRIDRDGTVSWSVGEQAKQLQARSVILANGAQERPYALQGWTLPGVMTVGAGQILLKAQGIVPEQAVLAGNGPLLYLYAVQLIRAGRPPLAILETRADGAWLKALPHLTGALKSGKRYLWKGVKMLATIRRAGIPHYRGVRELQALGDDDLKAVSFVCRGETHQLQAGVLLVHQGVIPNTQMTRALGAEHYWNDTTQCWQPQTDEWGELILPANLEDTGVVGIYLVGDGAAINGAVAAELSGEIGALRVLHLQGHLTRQQFLVRAKPLQHRLQRECQIRPFLDQLYTPDDRDVLHDDTVVVCRCENVSAGELREIARQGCLGLNQAKAFSRCGMGPCQGRQCGLTAAKVMADERGVDISEIDYYRIRPPIKPVTLQELAGLAVD